MTQRETEGEIPPRGDGGEWQNHMLIVARERALGADWPTAADAADLSPKTVRNYPGRYPGWDDLVEHYRQRAFDERLDEHWVEGSLEALDALRSEFQEAAGQLQAMEQRAADGELEPEEAEEAMSLSRAVVYAATKYLEATGRKKYQQTVAKLRAQEEVTGKAGDQLKVTHALDDKDDMDADELSEAYRQAVREGDEG